MLFDYGGRGKNNGAANKLLDARRKQRLSIAILLKPLLVRCRFSPHVISTVRQLRLKTNMLLSDEKHLKNLESEKQFNKRLAQTIFWCASRADLLNPKDCLRTPELRPRILEEDRFSAVKTVAIERERYGGVEIRDAQLPKDLGGGRLLVYFPDVNLCCGASEDETNGFFDVDNVPAWDTWVAYFAGGERPYANYLISWIPPQLVELVSRGIYVNPEECIVWLEDAGVSFAYDLRREGFLA